MFTPEGLGVTPVNFLLPFNFRQIRQTDDRQTTQYSGLGRWMDDEAFEIYLLLNQ